MSEQYGTVEKVAVNEMVVDKVVGRWSVCIKTSSVTEYALLLLFIPNSCSLIGQGHITCNTMNNDIGLQQLILGDSKF